MRSIINRIIPWSWAFLWFMLPISMKGSMLGLWIFTFLVIIQSVLKRPVIKREQAVLMILPAALFIWLFVSGICRNTFGEMMPFMERKASLLLIPFLLLLSQNLRGVTLKWAMRGFISGLTFTGVHMIFNAILAMLGGIGTENWTYHAFTAPYEIGAIYYSWYLSIAIAYLIFSEKDVFLSKYYPVIMLLLLSLLLLSSSKLFIIISVPLIIWSLLGGIKVLKNRILVLIVMSLILMVGAIPFLQRMEEVSTFDPEVITQDQYAYDTPLNGVTLRLIQWRFGFEILNENRAWFSGVGQVNTQDLLNDKYRQYGLYTGYENSDDSGFLDYNYHNQFMETLLASGLVGLLILLMLLLSAIIYYRKLLIFPLAVILFTTLFFFTESVLERQAGILIFCLIICFSPSEENLKAS